MLPHAGPERPDPGVIAVSINIYHIRHEIARCPFTEALRKTVVLAGDGMGK